MTDNELFAALRALDRPAEPDAAFRDGLLTRLTTSAGLAKPLARRRTSRPLTALAVAAALSLAVFAAYAWVTLRSDTNPGLAPSLSAQPSYTALPSPTARVTPTPRSSPIGSEDFTPAFHYVLPAGLTMSAFGEPSSVIELIHGPSTGLRYGMNDQGQVPLGTRGLTVASVGGDDANTHPCPAGRSSRIGIRTSPSGLLEDLHELGGVNFGESIATTVDGLPAVVTSVQSMECAGADFHTSNSHVFLDLPAQLTLVEADGVTVVLQTWAASEEELAAWLPTATEIIDSITFDR